MDEVPWFRSRKGGELFVERDLSQMETNRSGEYPACKNQEVEEGQGVLITQCLCSNLRLRIHRPFGTHGATMHPPDAIRCLSSALSSTLQKRWKGSHFLRTSCRVTSGFPS